MWEGLSFCKKIIFYICTMLIPVRKTYFQIFLFFVLLFAVIFKTHGQIIIYESKNDSIDISNNFYDFSDTLLYIFTDTLIFPMWDTSRLHNVASQWAELGDSIILPLLLTPQQRYIHPYRGQVTSKFGYRRNRYHYGTDVNLNDGDTVVAAFDGYVRYTDYYGGYGNVIVIRHFNGLETLYAHLSKIETEVGKFVFAGDLIGLGGRTGRSYGAHLHFETRFRGIAINPQDLIDFENYRLKSDTLILYQKNFATVNSSSPRITTGGGSGSGASGSADVQYHTVKSGDTLTAIAVRYKTTVDNLCRLNNIKRTSILRLGQKIRVR
jgi:murein DD-endopeptidase MepM/ murein hydrolase activator NlpD